MPQPENSIKPANAMSPRLLTTTGLLCSQSSISPLPPSRFLEYLQPFSASESVCPLRYHKAVDHPSKRSVPQTIKCFVPLGSRSFKPLMPCCVPDLFSLCLTEHSNCGVPNGLPHWLQCTNGGIWIVLALNMLHAWTICVSPPGMCPARHVRKAPQPNLQNTANTLPKGDPSLWPCCIPTLPPSVGSVPAGGTLPGYLSISSLFGWLIPSLPSPPCVAARARGLATRMVCVPACPCFPGGSVPRWLCPHAG
jgi:hypothetical protein